MGIVDITKTGDFTLGVWRVEESENKLKEIVGGDYFPGLTRMTHPRRRLEWLAARSLLRDFGYSGHVMYHPTRRPFLANSRSHLSISHSYPLVAVILSEQYYVGVDIESYTRPFVQVAHKYLSKHETEWLDLEDNRKLALIWSAKEAIYKLPGMDGLGGVDMDVKPIENLYDKGMLKANVRIGGTVQHFEVNYFYMDYFNVVWVCCNPKTLAWL